MTGRAQHTDTAIRRRQAPDHRRALARPAGVASTLAVEEQASQAEAERDRVLPSARASCVDRGLLREAFYRTHYVGKVRRLGRRSFKLSFAYPTR